MRDKIFLVADCSGVVRMTKRPPSLHREEVAVSISVNIPDGVFRHPIIAVTLEVPEDRVVHPTAEIEALELPEQPND